jgi:hypothetical protein
VTLLLKYYFQVFARLYRYSVLLLQYQLVYVVTAAGFSAPTPDLGLPHFLVERGGLNSGFMIAHCTAAALVSGTFHSATLLLLLMLL